MITLSAELLALSLADRTRLAAQILDEGDQPEMALLLLDRIRAEVIGLCIQREATWRERKAN